MYKNIHLYSTCCGWTDGAKSTSCYTHLHEQTKGTIRRDIIFFRRLQLIKGPASDVSLL